MRSRRCTPRTAPRRTRSSLPRFRRRRRRVESTGHRAASQARPRRRPTRRRSLADAAGGWAGRYRAARRSGRRRECGSIPTTRRSLATSIRAYALTGQTDSVVSVTNRIIAKDTTAVAPALAAAKVLIEGKTSKPAAGDTTAKPDRHGQPGAVHQTTQGSACRSSNSRSSTATPRPRRTRRRCCTRAAPRSCSNRRTWPAPRVAQVGRVDG